MDNNNGEAIAASRKIAELSEFLERREQELAESQRECESLNDRLAFIADVIQARVEQNSGIVTFRKLLDEDYQKYANQNSFNPFGASALKTLQEVGTQLELVSRDSQIMGKTIIAIGGAFSSGKSSFMNSLFSQDKVSLPVGMDQTTAIASYVLDGEDTEITGYSYRGARVNVPEKIFSLFTYRKKDEFKLNMKLIIDDIVFKTSFVQPYENICFIDTPGFNPGYSSELDYNTAITAIAGAQALLWCFDVSGGTIHDDDFNILRDILNVNPDMKIYIIANRADLKSLEENAEIIEQAEMLLQENSIGYDGISLYTSIKKFSSQPDDYKKAARGNTLAEFLAENNQPDTSKEEEIVKQVISVFDGYIEADEKYIADTQKRIESLSSIESKVLDVVGRKDETILDYKSRISLKNLKSSDETDENTDDDMSAVSESIGEIRISLQENLKKARDDRAAVRGLRKKFEDCICSIFGDKGEYTHRVWNNKTEAAEQYSRGDKYYHGDGVEQDFGEAFKWFHKSAEQGNANAQLVLGFMFSNGQGVEQNYFEAADWYRQAAEQNNAVAQNNLGQMYETGHGIEQNYTEAFRWYRKSAEQGNANAQFRLGNMYCVGQGVEQDYIIALTWYKKAAVQEYAVAENKIGDLYRNGYGVKQNYDEAMKWYLKAAEQNEAVAMNNLGMMYEHGLGKLDYAEAVKWYRTAAEQSDATALNNLGRMYENGYGVERDYGEALKLYNQAAEKGDSSAQKQLGDMYYNGRGVKEDYGKAVKWYRKAAAQQDTEAQNCIGDMYKNYAEHKDNELGFSILSSIGNFGTHENAAEKDFFCDMSSKDAYIEAVKWYRKAAELGDDGAQKKLGDMYCNGNGVKQDYEEAKSWYLKAAERGYDEASNALGNMFYIKKDYAEAMKWYMKSVEQGFNSITESDPFAAIADMYRLGLGVCQDNDLAVKWYCKDISRRICCGAQFLFMSYIGESSTKETLVELFRRTAEYGNADGQVCLGAIYEEGIVVEQDCVEACKWYKRAAEQRHLMDSFWYREGNKYENGIGCKQDYAQAAEYYRKALQYS